MTSLGKAGLVGFEVLIFSTVGRFLTSGLWACKSWFPVTLLAFFFLLLASASFPHLEAGLFALEGGPDRRCRHVLAK